MRFPLQFVRARIHWPFYQTGGAKIGATGETRPNGILDRETRQNRDYNSPAAVGQKHGTLGVGAPSSTSGAPRTLLFSTLLTLTNAPALRPQSTQSTNRVWSWFPLLHLLLARQVIFCADTAPHTGVSVFFFRVLGVFLCFLSLHTLHVCIHVRRTVLRGRL